MSVALTTRHRKRPQARIAQSKTVVWNPLNKQYIDPDTTFLLDPDADTANGLTIGLGALLNGKDSLAPSIVAGKYRKGIQPTTSTALSWLWMPVDGVIPRYPTIEAWLNSTADWTTLGEGFALGGGAAGADLITFNIASSQLTVTISHTQNPASPGSYSFSATSAAFSSGTYPAGTWVNVAATLTTAGTLTVYINGTQVAQTTGGVAPTVWGSETKQDGLFLPGSGGHSSSHLTISDVRISRTARVPGVPVTVTSLNTVVVANTLTGATVQKLNGSVKPLTGSASGSGLKQLPLAAASATQGSQKGISVIREDKFLQATPILASGTPDATHPTVGHSGSFCYDWQVLDRAMNYIVNTLGCEPYISFCDVPSILGGTNGPYTDTALLANGAQTPDVSGTMAFTTTPPSLGNNPKMFAWGSNVYGFTGTSGNNATGVTLLSGTSAQIPNGATVHFGPLTCGYTHNAPENAGPPSSNANLATICADLAYHVLNENNGITGLPLPIKPTYWGLWNEPDQTGEWSGSTQAADYQALYAAVAPALKAVSASIKVGGPEVSAWFGGTATTWIQGLINYCGVHSLPLDFVSWHTYSGNPGEFVSAQLQLQQWATAAGISTPALIVGEWGWAQRWTAFSPNVGYYPFCQPNGQNNGNNIPPVPQTGRVDFAINDWCAAYHTFAMILMQSSGVVRAFHYTGDDASLFDQNSVPQALYNAMRLWSKILGLSVLSATVTADPGLQALCAKDGSGNVYVLVANLHYRKPTSATAYPVSVDVSAFSRADGSPVTAYVVDDSHSNAYDTQGASTTLQTVSVSSVLGGRASINLRPRAVALLVI